MSGSGQVSGTPAERDRADDAPGTVGERPDGGPARPLLDDVDGLLDEIDAVLENNAEEFVRGYVQKGGQ